MALRRRCSLLGIGGDAPAGIINEMRSDMLGEWLPFALADIAAALCGVRRQALLRSWGLDALADRADDAEVSAFLDAVE